jgi:hypothetical protein
MWAPEIKELRRHILTACGAVAVGAATAWAGDNDAPPRQPVLTQTPQIIQAAPAAGAARQRLDGSPATVGRAYASDGAPGEAEEPGKDAAKKPADDSIKKAVAEYMKEQEKKKKEDEEAAKRKLEEEGFKVGSDLKMTVRWNTANGVTFETPNKDFTAHIGYRFQLDNVYWTQNDNIRPPTQIGDLEDGIFFRRSRPSFDGTAWEIMEWNCELALEQVQNGVPNFDECWVGIQKVPIIGNIRIGHNKVPQGFEGDMVSSSKAMTFLERPP